MAVEKSLRKLQQVIRTPSEPEPQDRMYVEIPADLAQEQGQGLGLCPAEKALLQQVGDEIGRDLRFEHLTDVKNVLHRFIAEAWVDRKTDHVPAFILKHARKIESVDCVLTLLYLEVQERFKVSDMLLLPIGDALVPKVPDLATEPDCRGYISVRCTGTSYKKMVERARAQARRALALLRLGLQQQYVYDPTQLRFRLAW